MGREVLSRGSTQLCATIDTLRLVLAVNGAIRSAIVARVTKTRPFRHPLSGGFHALWAEGALNRRPPFSVTLPDATRPDLRFECVCGLGGRYRTRTYDLLDVNEAL